MTPMDFAFTTAPERVAASMCRPMAWEAMRLGHRAHAVSVRRGPEGLQLLMENADEALPVDPFVYGHTGLMSAIAEGAAPGWRTDWRPEQYDRALWIERCGELMWNKNARILTLEAALREWTEGPMHLCPSGADSGPKAFKGFFCDRSDVGFELPRAARGNALDSGMRVALSAPDAPEEEYRCVFIQGRLVAAGLYFKDGSLTETSSAPERVEAFAKEAAAIWLPGDFCVMDIAASGSRLGVIEFNGLNCSGLYSLPRADIIGAIAEAWPQTLRPLTRPR